MDASARSRPTETSRVDLGATAGPFAMAHARCLGEPDGRPRESAYTGPVIGVVVSGAFDYRGEAGQVAATPGTILLGNAGETFSYVYRDSREIRRSVIALQADLISEIAADCDLDEAGFSAVAISPSRQSATLYGAVLRAVAGQGSPEAVIDLTASALRMGRKARAVGATVAEQRRVREVIHHIDEFYPEPCTLDELAGLAQLSRFHFIRVFRNATGESPHQYLMGARLRAAANRLMDSAESVTSVAFSVGFNDISNFNATFRKAFGMAPRAWRSRFRTPRRTSA